MDIIMAFFSYKQTLFLFLRDISNDQQKKTKMKQKTCSLDTLIFGYTDLF